MIVTSVTTDAQAGIKGYTAGVSLVKMAAEAMGGAVGAFAKDQSTVVDIGVGDLGENVGGSTDYMVKGAGDWVLTGVGLSSAYATTGGDMTRVGASIMLNRRANQITGGYLEVARIVAHEFTLHAMVVASIKDRLMAKDQDLQTGWANAVAPGGDLSQQKQHEDAAYGKNPYYQPLVEQMADLLAQNNAKPASVTLRKYHADDILGLKIEVAKREMGAGYAQHPLLANV